MGCGRDRDFGKKDLGCVCQAVRAIKDIQDAGDECNECRNDCFLEPLGSMVSPANRVNTRVFKLYLKNGDTFEVHVKGSKSKSPYFRVKEIFDNCCATLQVVIPNKNDDPNDPMDDWELTGDCVTVDLDCFCAIQCIKDVFVELCED
ncbi:CotY/CotZ family spore coat protein [Rossellomorea oryzaecorticis]|uniref:CotY/CotZ family spore coat protein n=1 Tax=Rossellomorea oryzaecorticis TaxID=1396505 RepID=A0ABU9KCP9_9BACI